MGVRMAKLPALLLFIFTSLTAGEITIAVAANVSYAIDDLKSEFAKKHPDIKIRTILGSSGKLTAQIKNGAPYGIFLSADIKYPEALYKEDLAISKPVVYAEGALALFSIKKYDYSRGIALLLSDTIQRIAIANPKTAPYGKAALEAIKKSGLYEKVKHKFVFGESISQTVAYAVTAADIGLIAKSSLYSPKMLRYREGKNWSSIDPKLYAPIKQGIVILKTGGGNPDYRIFYDFILSKKAKEIFRRYGYIE